MNSHQISHATSSKNPVNHCTSQTLPSSGQAPLISHSEGQKILSPWCFQSCAHDCNKKVASLSKPVIVLALTSAHFFHVKCEVRISRELISNSAQVFSIFLLLLRFFSLSWSCNGHHWSGRRNSHFSPEMRALEVHRSHKSRSCNQLHQPWTVVWESCRYAKRTVINSYQISLSSLYAPENVPGNLPENYRTVILPLELEWWVWGCVLWSFWWELCPHFLFGIKIRRLQIEWFQWWSRPSDSMPVPLEGMENKYD